MSCSSFTPRIGLTNYYSYPVGIYLQSTISRLAILFRLSLILLEGLLDESLTKLPSSHFTVSDVKKNGSQGGIP